MNLKKGLLNVLTIMAVVTGTLSSANVSQASTANPAKKFRIEYTRRASLNRYQTGFSGSKGTADGVPLWKIYEYNSNENTVKNDNNAIYCLKMGVGFGFTTGTSSEIVDYNKYADMKNPTTTDDQNLINSYKATLASGSNYNSLVWLLNNAYVPAKSKNPTTEEINAATASKQQLLTNAGISTRSALYTDSAFNNDLIDIVQQLAIWRFSNNDVYSQEFSNIQYLLNGETTYEDLDMDLADDVDQLYEYLVTQAEANRTTPVTNGATNPTLSKLIW